MTMDFIINLCDCNHIRCSMPTVVGSTLFLSLFGSPSPHSVVGK